MTVSPITSSLTYPETGSMIGAPQVPGLTSEEQAMVIGLSFKLTMQNTYALKRWAYYDGLQRMNNLGIAVPPQLQGVRTVVDWPRICVDPLVQRTVVDGFRLAGATDVDDELAEHWMANNMNAEAPLTFLDAFVAGRGYMIVGSPDQPGDSPIITVESPSNLAMQWDPRTRRVLVAYQAYQAEGRYYAALYLPNVNIYMSRWEGFGWVIDYRDEHNFGEVSVVRFANRARSSDREGRSEITAPIMNTTDSAVRSLLGMEIAREVYSIPRLAILGANESDFQDAAGQPKSAVDLAMTKILALERDEEGNVPVLQQLTAFDPSVFTRIIDTHAKLMASYTGFPPDYFGQTADVNPASGDSIVSSREGMVRHSEQAQNQFTEPLREVMKLVWRFSHNGVEVPKAIKRMGVDWVPAESATPAATTDAIVKQVSVGAVPPTSDVTLARLGYSAVERARLEVDRQADPSQQTLAELSHLTEAKDARSSLVVSKELDSAGKPKPPPSQATGVTPTPSPGG